jgi:hypothetical protein
MSYLSQITDAFTHQLSVNGWSAELNKNCIFAPYNSSSCSEMDAPNDDLSIVYDKAPSKVNETKEILNVTEQRSVIIWDEVRSISQTQEIQHVRIH